MAAIFVGGAGFLIQEADVCNAVGPNAKCHDVRYGAAIEVKADLVRLPKTDANDPLYGPAVRRKRVDDLAIAVLHQCIRPLVGAFAPGHYGYQRACGLVSR